MTPPFAFEDVVRTTMGGATNAHGAKLSPAEIDKVIAYLKSPGSGVDATSSYADYVAKEMAAHPPKLPAGVDYVAFSGSDGSGKSNYRNASEYVADTKGKADIIGHTPWGEYIDKCKATAEFKTINQEFTRYLASEHIEVYAKNPAGALQDMMWNAGSAPYMENAVHSGRPIVAFVENAPPNRGFSNFELPEALKSPTTIVNGHPISDFGPNPLAFASKSAAEFQKLEQSLADGTVKANGQKVSLAEFRADVHLINGYNATQKTVFGQPLSDFSKLKFEQMSATSKAWNVPHAGVVVHPPAEPRVGEASAKAVELHPPTGPPKSVIGEVESGVRIRPGEAAKGAAGGEIGVGAMAKGALGVVGTAAVLYDAAHTASRASDMRQQGNLVGANSEVGHFYARTGGMLAGAEAGAAGGALLFSETGPGALVAGGVGGIVGAIGGEKVAQAIDYHHIYNQTDPQGNHWQFDPKRPDDGWTRLRSTGEPDLEAMSYASEGVLIEKYERLTADPALKNQLDYKASNAAIGLTLAHPPTPRDPYTIPANEHDTHSLRYAPWMRDPQTHQWSRTIADGLLDYRVMNYRTEVASPQRAAELEQSSQRIISGNVAHSAQRIAQDYRTAYEQRGWNQFGGVPAVVTNTLNTQGNVFEASDGHTYTRDAKGQWNTPGMLWGTNAAEGSVRAELDATRQAQQAAAAPHPASATPPTAAPTIAPTPQALRLDDPQHPDHKLFDQTREQVAALDQKLGRKPDQHTDNITAAVVVQARAAGLSRIDQVTLSPDHSKLWATQATPGAKDHFLDRQTSVPTAAANTPVEQSSAQWPKAMQQYQEAQALQAQQGQQQPNQQTAGPGR